MKLQAKITDTEGGYERVVLCPFKNEDGESVWIEEVERFGRTMFKVVLDEGYVKTEYFYPVPRFAITELEKYE